MATIRERNGKFQAIVRVHEGSKVIHQESKTFDTRRLAEKWGDDLEERIKRHGLVAHISTATTVGALIRKYRILREEVKPLRRTAAGELDQLEFWLGKDTLAKCDDTYFVNFARRRKQQGAGPATIMHNLSTLRSIFGAAAPAFGIRVSAEPIASAIKILQRTKHVAKSNSRERRPTQDEIDGLVKEFERIKHHPSTEIPMEKIVPLLIALPRRREEMCTVEWRHYKDGILTLVDTKHPTETRNERVPVPAAAREIIESLPRLDAKILPYKPESVSASFQRAVKRLEIEDLRLHDLRHEGICRLFESGLGIEEVALISGHTSWTTLKRYTHLRPETLLEKMNARSQGT